MLFVPDIVVMEPAATAPALIVEVKLTAERSVEAVQALKTYMVRSRCPVGLLVSPDRLTIFSMGCRVRPPTSTSWSTWNPATSGASSRR